ncbi:MAG: sulfatase-like hydrolase/transferase, partial [Candidatus Thiodiazotropha sp. 6PLUC5]
NSWGFDKVIGPNVGVADFVLSSLSDIPAINISISAFPAVSEIIFPFTTYNRAAWKSYLPKRFSDKLDRELAQDFDSPIFLAVHFCIAHTPYKWGNITPPPKLDFSPIGTNWHYKAIKAADDQVGQLIDTLGKSGRLKNAIIVLLSDHGEGLGFQTRTFTAESNIPPAGENPYDFKTLEFSFGHGSNLNEPNINQAVLGINQYIDSKPIAPHSKQTTPATLIDIMPTILELTAIDTESQKSLSGISLAPFLSNPKEPLPDRFRFLETGLSTFALNTRSPSHTDLLNTMSEFFTINSSGRLELILDRYPSVMRKKTLAVIHGKWQLTMYPFNELGIRQLLFNRESGEWTDKTESSLWTEANGQQLKEKLIGFFGVDGMEALDPELHLIHLKSRI